MADWLGAARGCLERLDQAGARAVVAGGTGLYVTALVDGFDLARVPPDPQRRVERGEVAATPDGLDVLAAELRQRDPDGAATIDQRNPRRVIRALEILDAGGGSVLATRTRSAPRASVLVGLDVARPEHERWIEQRVARMFDTGALQDEVRRLLAQGLDPHTIGGCGIGYQEALDNLEGRLGLDAAKEATVRRTLRYARAQRTWFRRELAHQMVPAGPRRRRPRPRRRPGLRQAIRRVAFGSPDEAMDMPSGRLERSCRRRSCRPQSRHRHREEKHDACRGRAEQGAQPRRETRPRVVRARKCCAGPR